MLHKSLQDDWHKGRPNLSGEGVCHDIGPKRPEATAGYRGLEQTGDSMFEEARRQMVKSQVKSIAVSAL